MSTIEQTWLGCQTAFKETIAQAEKREQIEQYYYKFTAHLAEQGYCMRDIERIIPMIQATMKDVINEKFTASPDPTQLIPVIDRDSDDIVIIKTNVRAYNRVANWMNGENLKSNSRPHKKRYKGDLWMKVVEIDSKVTL